MTGTATDRRLLTRREARMIAEELFKLMEDARPQAEEEWLDVDEAAEYMRCSKWKIYHDRAVLPHVKNGGKLLFSKAGLSRHLKR